ncbi:MAG: hypothetical protein ACRECH_16025, partial [Nitrososphaerales archaeon]
AAQGGIRAWLMREINEIKVQLAEIRGDAKAVNTKIDGLDEKIDMKVDSLRNELKADIQRVDSSVKDLDERLDIVQRLTLVEAKLKER